MQVLHHTLKQVAGRSTGKQQSEDRTNFRHCSLGHFFPFLHSLISSKFLTISFILEGGSCGRKGTALMLRRRKK